MLSSVHHLHRRWAWLLFQGCRVVLGRGDELPSLGVTAELGHLRVALLLRRRAAVHLAPPHAILRHPFRSAALRRHVLSQAGVSTQEHGRLDGPPEGRRLVQWRAPLLIWPREGNVALAEAVVGPPELVGRALR